MYILSEWPLIGKHESSRNWRAFTDQGGKLASPEVISFYILHFVMIILRWPVKQIIEANEEERRLIFSEKQASLIESLRQIQVGSIFDGKVNSVADFGAFVDLQLPDGKFFIYPFHLHICVLWIVLCPTSPCILLLLILRKR